MILLSLQVHQKLTSSLFVVAWCAKNVEYVEEVRKIPYVRKNRTYPPQSHNTAHDWSLMDVFHSICPSKALPITLEPAEKESPKIP